MWEISFLFQEKLEVDHDWRSSATHCVHWHSHSSGPISMNVIIFVILKH